MSINSFQNIALENVDAAKTLDADSVSEQRLYIKRFFELIRKKSAQLLLKVRSVFNRKRDKKMKRKISVSQHSW